MQAEPDLYTNEAGTNSGNFRPLRAEFATLRRLKRRPPERLGASPGNMLALLQLHRDVDIRHVLPAISVPTLVLHRVRRGPEPDRVLTTILFTDIVGSTERAARAGDSTPSRVSPARGGSSSPHPSDVLARLYGVSRNGG
jgi:hypothetical protein